jgi:hypothetical protein
MNNKILIGSGVAIVIVGAFLLFSNSNSEVKNPLQSSQSANISKINKKNVVESEKIIHNKAISNKKNINTKKIKSDEKQVDNLVENGNNFSFDKEKNEYIFNEKSFDNFADENNLEEVGSVDDNTKIYAKNPPIKNDFAPPMPPILIKVKFKEDTKIVPLNSNLVNANKKIYVAKKNENNKKVEVKEIDTKTISSFTPPAIGQN